MQTRSKNFQLKEKQKKKDLLFILQENKQSHHASSLIRIQPAISGTLYEENEIQTITRRLLAK